MTQIHLLISSSSPSAYFANDPKSYNLPSFASWMPILRASKASFDKTGVRQTEFLLSMLIIFGFKVFSQSLGRDKTHFDKNEIFNIII